MCVWSCLCECAITCLSHSDSRLATFSGESSWRTDRRANTSASGEPSALSGLMASELAPASARW